MKKVKIIYKETSALVWKETNLYVAKSLEVEIASQEKLKMRPWRILKKL